MRSVNKVILIGNITRDPEMRQTPNGQNVTTFGIATNREWVTHDGKKHSLAEFHDLVAWARLAEICSTHLKKGKLIYIEGYLKTRSWDTPEGVRKFKTEIVVQDMIMLDKRPQGEAHVDDYIPEEETHTTMATPNINEELDLGTRIQKKPAPERTYERRPERPAVSQPHVSREAYTTPKPETVGVVSAESISKSAEPSFKEAASESSAPGSHSINIDDDLGL